MPLFGCDSKGKKIIAEAGYMSNGAEHQRYFTPARSKSKREVTISLDPVYLTVCRTHGTINFTVINHTR